jgi:hypothetical protein
VLLDVKWIAGAVLVSSVGADGSVGAVDCVVGLVG